MLHEKVGGRERQRKEGKETEMRNLQRMSLLE